MKPDWKQTSDYQFAKDLTPAGWAWEFLRRNAKYRAAYAAYEVEAQEIEKKFGPKWRTISQARIYDPPLIQGENYSLWLRRVAFKEGKRARLDWLDKLKGEPFGLDGMFDPLSTPAAQVRFLSSSTYPRLAETLSSLEEIYREGWDGEVLDQNAAKGGEFCLVVFDLTLPIDKQLKKLKGRLVALRDRRQIKKPKAPAPYVTAWIRYLRLLDADLAQATDSEIAETIWPDPKLLDPIGTAMEARKQAKAWTKPDEYLRLLPL